MATIEAHELEGVRHYIEWTLGADDVFPVEPGKWREGHERIGWLLDLDDMLEAHNPPVVIEGSPFLEQFAKEGAEYGASVLSDALTGRMDHPEKYARIGKGLISFADRLGVYEGVTV